MSPARLRNYFKMTDTARPGWILEGSAGGAVWNELDPADGDMLIYDAASETWTPVPVPASLAPWQQVFASAIDIHASMVAPMALLQSTPPYALTVQNSALNALPLVMIQDLIGGDAEVRIRGSALSIEAAPSASGTFAVHEAAAVDGQFGGGITLGATLASTVTTDLVAENTYADMPVLLFNTEDVTTPAIVVTFNWDSLEADSNRLHLHLVIEARPVQTVDP